MAEEKKKATTEAKPKKMEEAKPDTPQEKESSGVDNKNNSEQEQRRPRRQSNTEFFSRDILGDSRRDRLIKPVQFKSRTGQSLYNLTYDRVDGYLHRPKEISTLAMARDVNEQIQKIIHNRLKELEDYVNKRHKKVKNLYDMATAIEKYELDDSHIQEDKAGFSNSYSKRYLAVLEKIDDACYMASYLEKVGELDMRQEANITSELYRKSVQISRGMMRFIGRSVIGVRRQLREQRQAQSA